MCQVWLLQQNTEEETLAASLWRSIHIRQKICLLQAHRVGYPPPGRAVAVQVTLGGTPVTIFSVYTPRFEHLKTQDLSRLINYSLGSLSNDTRGDVIERFTDRNNLCILNDGSPTYLKPQAQHSHSAIDLSICTTVHLLDVHGGSSLTNMVVTIIRFWYLCLLLVETQTRGLILATGWEQFIELCMDKVTDDIPHNQDPFTSFVANFIDAATDGIPRATTIPQKCKPWFGKECREMLKTRRALDRKVHRGKGLRLETRMSFRWTQAQTRWLFTQKRRESWTQYVSKLNSNTPITNVRNRLNKISGKTVCPPKQYLNRKDSASITNPKTLLTSLQQHSQITPPLPTTVPNSRPSRHMIWELEFTSLLTTLKSTTSPSDWEIWDFLSWRPNPVHLDLMGPTITCWSTSLRTHYRSSKRSWTTSGSLVISLLNGERQRWSPSPSQTRTTLKFNYNKAIGL